MACDIQSWCGRVLVIVLAMAFLIGFLCPVQSFDLRVDSEFKRTRITAINVPELIFISNSSVTGLLAILLSSPVLIFSDEFTFVDMEWRAYFGELVEYNMTIRSGNLSIMGQPTADVPLSGNLTMENYTSFRTIMPCMNVDGTTTLEVDMYYRVWVRSADDEPFVILFPWQTALLRMRKSCKYVPVPPSPTIPPNTSMSPTTVEVTDAGEAVPLPLVIGVAGGACLLAVLILVMLLVYLRRTKRQGRNRLEVDGPAEGAYNGTRSIRSTGTAAYTRTSLPGGSQPLPDHEVVAVMEGVRKKWEENLHGLLLKREYIDIGDEIGRGAYGRVLVGNLNFNGITTKVAIKTLKCISNAKDVDEVLEEAFTMKELDHPNVIPIYGVCMEGNDPPLMCLEFMHNGDLRTYMKRSRGLNPNLPRVPDLTVPQILEFCAMILDGMLYLTKHNIVHRDLACRNCLVNERLVVKIADFGLSRHLESHEDFYLVTSKNFLPVKWLALESLMDQIFDKITDVWSFGMVMWEIFSLGQNPYPGIQNADMKAHLVAGGRPEQPEMCPDAFYTIMRNCWIADRALRPTFDMLAEELADKRDDFYDDIGDAQCANISFSQMLGRSGRKYALIPVKGDGDGSAAAMQHYNRSLQRCSIAPHYVEAGPPTSPFGEQRLLGRGSQEDDNPNYDDGVGDPRVDLDSFNPNYHPMTPNVGTPDQHLTTNSSSGSPRGNMSVQAQIPLVDHSYTPASGATGSDSSPPRMNGNLPSPVLEEDFQYLRSPASSIYSQSHSLNEERRKRAVEVDL